MFRKLRKTLHQVGPDATRRRKRRYAPNLGESAAILEDRQLLSGAGDGKPTPAAPPVAASGVRSVADQVTGGQLNSVENSPAGLFVIGEYESILLRAPAPVEVSASVQQLNHGLSKSGLQKALLKSSDRQQLLATLGIDINGSPQAFVSSLYTNVLKEQPDPAGEAAFVTEIRQIGRAHV